MTDNEQRYEQWRQLWLRGAHSEAVTVMIYHGLYAALMMTAPVVSAPVVVVQSPPQCVGIAVNEPSIAMAAQCVRNLLSDQLSACPSWRSV